MDKKKAAGVDGGIGGGWGLMFEKEEKSDYLFQMEDFLLDDENQHQIDEINLPPAAAVSTFQSPPHLLPSDLNLPEEEKDVAHELEWVSRMMDDSQSELPNHQELLHHHHQSSKEAIETLEHPRLAVMNKGKRSKRVRRSILSALSSSWSSSSSRQRFIERAIAKANARPSTPLLDSSSSSSTTTTTNASTCSTTSSSSCSSSSTSSPCQLIYAPRQLFDDIPVPFPRPPLPQQKTNKKRGPKPKPKTRKVLDWVEGGGSGELPFSSSCRTSTTNDNNKSEVGRGELGRCCSHCGVNKTPQWRMGPTGAKSLCNACGVRYKSGRLLPEYRPASSPTFINHLHSNSHRKVIQMRRNKEQQQDHSLLSRASF